MLKTAILINFGVDIRHFYLSGFYKELKKNTQIIFLVKKNSLSKKLIDNYNIDAIEFDDNFLEPKNYLIKIIYSKFESFFTKILKARERKFFKVNYHFTKGETQTKSKIIDLLLGSELLYKNIRFFKLFFDKYYYKSKQIEKILKNNNIENLIYYSSRVDNLKFITITAKQCNINLYNYSGYWKIISLDYYLDAMPKKVFLWNNEDEKYLSKFYPKNKNTHVVTGDWFLNSYTNYLVSKKRDYYQTKYNFNSNQKIFLMPLSMKVVFKNELELVIKINNYISNLEIEHKPIILLRENPFEINTTNIYKIKSLEHVRCCENFWNVSKKEDFIFQNIEGENEWKDLLFYSDAIISTPSTVSLEGLLSRKICLNILFDETENYNNTIASFSKTKFYKPLWNDNNLKFLTNFSDFKKVFKDLLSDKINFEHKEYVFKTQMDNIMNEFNTDYEK